MTWLDVSIVIVIVLFLILIVWSRIMHQTMLDTVTEIKDMLKEIKS